MTQLINSLPQILICLLICGVKILEITVQSIRVILQVKGQKTAAALLAFAECAIWGLVMSAVITSLADNMYWLFAYCLGFAIGIYLGSIIENRLALGKVNLQFMCDESDGNEIIKYLISQKKGFTAFEGFGYHGKRYKINTVVPRKDEKKIVQDIHIITSNVFVVSNEVGRTIGGYGLRK